MEYKKITYEDIRRVNELLHELPQPHPIQVAILPDDQIEQFKIDIMEAIPATYTPPPGNPLSTLLGVKVMSESEFVKYWFIHHERR